MSQLLISHCSAPENEGRQDHPLFQDVVLSRVDSHRPSLVVHLESQCPLECDHTEHWSIRSTKFLYHWRYWIYTGTLVRPGTAETRNIVLKINTGEHVKALTHEADVYENCAKDLQGTVIPVCFGLFHTVTLENCVITCLVTEYCGENLDANELSDLEIDFGWNLLRQVDLLHRHGLRHKDLSVSNILSNNGTPFLIDLEKAEEHTCERALRIKEGCVRPMSEDFDCREMYMLVVELCRIWDNETVVDLKNGLLIDMDRLMVTPPEEIVKMVERAFPGQTISIERAREIYSTRRKLQWSPKMGDCQPGPRIV
ncbi:hypothetical protein Hypma_006193 [Hypsizygus marmoreus]|uniref:Protein kinase domain-containing protein n=1 Tax=Hypsizygus marmoreus TaxID=39966 RepID=A0A369K031_HYPMA|nr:hypothetical protein Hypma_006193 [Hypsizygus marmoreus]